MVLFAFKDHLDTRSKTRFYHMLPIKNSQIALDVSHRDVKIKIKNEFADHKQEKQNDFLNRC